MKDVLQEITILKPIKYILVLTTTTSEVTTDTRQTLEFFKHFNMSDERTFLPTLFMKLKMLQHHIIIFLKSIF